MKATLIANPSPEPIDPWLNVSFPCLVEHRRTHEIAIATSRKAGMVLVAATKAVFGLTHNEVGHTFGEDSGSWEASDYVPIKRPVTITFEN